VFSLFFMLVFTMVVMIVLIACQSRQAQTMDQHAG
jgi:hypothetical protein